jgi:hypothetical protein
MMKCHGVKEFNLKGLKWKEYKDTCFHDGDCVLVVELWLHRVDVDESGITFGTGPTPITLCFVYVFFGKSCCYGFVNENRKKLNLKKKVSLSVTRITNS